VHMGHRRTVSGGSRDIYGVSELPEVGMRRTKEDAWLVQCPKDPDLYYFAWYCREQKALGIGPCATCEAMEKTQTLQGVMDEITRS